MKKLALIISLLLITTTSGFSPTYLNFNGGQVSPLLEARIEFQKYSSSCRTMENMYSTVHGSAVRRPGTMYVAATKSNAVAVLAPFVVSTDDSYVLEFTNGFLRFYRDDGN